MKKITLLLIFAMMLSLLGCSSDEGKPKKKEEVLEGCELLITASDSAAAVPSVILSLEENVDKYENSYSMIFAEAEDNMMDIVNGDYDIALLPTDLAYYLYNRTEGSSKLLSVVSTLEISLLGINTEADSLEDLAGKSVYIRNEDSLILCVASALFSDMGIEVNTLSFDSSEMPNINVEETFILSSSPYTQGLMRESGFELIADLTDKAKDFLGVEHIPDEVIMVNTKFANANPGAIEYLKQEYLSAIEYISSNPESSLVYISDIGIALDEISCKDDLMNIPMVYYDGKEMKDNMVNFAKAMLDFDSSFGGKSNPGYKIFLD